MAHAVFEASISTIVLLAYLRSFAIAAQLLRTLLSRDRLVESHWGWVELALLPEILLLPLLATVLRPTVESDASLTRAAVAAIGALLALLGFAIYAWVGTHFRSMSAGHYIREDHQLVTDGPYRFARHPTYLGGFLIWLSPAVGFPSALTLLVASLYVVPAYVRYARTEEVMLSRAFGAAYAIYSNRVGMFFPKLGNSGKAAA